jgi:hypothetical protein
MTDSRASAADDRAYRLLVEAVVDYAVYLLDTEGRVIRAQSASRDILPRR